MLILCYRPKYQKSLVFVRRTGRRMLILLQGQIPNVFVPPLRALPGRFPDVPRMLPGSKIDVFLNKNDGFERIWRSRPLTRRSH